MTETPIDPVVDEPDPWVDPYGDIDNTWKFPPEAYVADDADNREETNP